MSVAETESTRLTLELREHILRAAYAFHVRAFGEELARISFSSLEERKRHVSEMVDHAGKTGMNLERPALGVKHEAPPWCFPS